MILEIIFVFRSIKADSLRLPVAYRIPSARAADACAASRISAGLRRERGEDIAKLFFGGCQTRAASL